MREIISPAQAEAMVRGAALVLLGIGIAVGVLGAIAASLRRRAFILGGLVALAGGLVYGLWMLYNGVISRFGLDSVKGLLINLGLFAAIGLLYGVIAARAWRWALRHLGTGG